MKSLLARVALVAALATSPGLATPGLAAAALGGDSSQQVMGDTGGWPPCDADHPHASSYYESGTWYKCGYHVLYGTWGYWPKDQWQYLIWPVCIP